MTSLEKSRTQTVRPQGLVWTIHSLMTAASNPASLAAMGEVIQRKAAEATAEAPLAHLRFEAGQTSEPSRLVEVRLTTWPGGEEHFLATADVNGRLVRPVAG
jgi:hypothetical protein